MLPSAGAGPRDRCFRFKAKSEGLGDRNVSNKLRQLSDSPVRSLITQVSPLDSGSSLILLLATISVLMDDLAYTVNHVTQ